MKGISPLIATVLLIAFTVAVAGIVNLWLTSFTRTSSETVSSQATTELICSYGGLSLGGLKYSSSTGNMSGDIENTGTIALGNITLQIIYTNATTNKIHLCLYGTRVESCSVSTFSTVAREKYSFNVSAGGSNYDKIRVISNCSTAYDEASSSEVSA